MKPNLHLTHHSTEFTKENIETFHLKLSPPKDQYMPDGIPSPLYSTAFFFLCY